MTHPSTEEMLVQNWSRRKRSRPYPRRTADARAPGGAAPEHLRPQGPRAALPGRERRRGPAAAGAAFFAAAPSGLENH